MITLDAAQQAAVDAQSKTVTWLFDLTLTDASTRHISTKSTTYGGQNYAGAVTGWQGVTMRRSQSETGIIAPADISLTIAADDLTITDLDGASLTVRLVVDGGDGPVEIRAWRYVVTGIQPAYGTIKLTAQSFVTSALSGSWPRSATALAAFPEADVTDDGYCVPTTFGTAYIPLRSVLSSGQRHYLLGPSGLIYTVSKVRAPRNSGATTEWNAGPYSMPQSTHGAYRTFQPIVADTDSDGTPDDQGLWRSGGRYLDPLVQFSRSDTAGLTNPADVIEYILRDIGLGDSDIDADAFASAKSTFAAWGLEWNFGLWTKQDRQKLLAQLLTACAATLDVGDRVGLRVLGGAVGAVGQGDVIRASKNGPGTFGYSSKTASTEDAGYIGWRQSTSPEDELLRVLVPVGDSTDNPSINILALGMITNPDHAQRIGAIYYQRKLTGKAAIVATLSSVWAGLQAGDIVTVSPAMYGGSYPVEIDSVSISKDLQVKIQATRYATAISHFAGLSFSSIPLATDSSTDPNAVWSLPTSGPDGAVGLNAMTGRLRIGDDIVLDAGAGALEMGDLAEGPGMSYRDGVLQLLGASLRIAASAAANVRSDLNVADGATNTTNTNQLVDGAGLGTTAIWGNTSGEGKPDDGADVTNYNDSRVANSELYYPDTTEIDGGKIRTGTVSANKIESNSITASQIAAGAITASEVGTNQIIAFSANIKDAVITNAKINDLNASKINAGYLNVNRINANTITVNKINAGVILQAGNGSTSTTVSVSGSFVLVFVSFVLNRCSSRSTDMNAYFKIGSTTIKHWSDFIQSDEHYEGGKYTYMGKVTGVGTLSVTSNMSIEESSISFFVVK